jgi:YfiH family protein
MINFFNNFPEILAVLSEREDGSMRLIQNGGGDSNSENRKKFFEKIGIGEKKVIAAKLAHTTRVEIVDRSSPNFFEDTDGLVTKDANIYLSVTVADCIPVFLFDPGRKIVGVLHCGWRGIVAGIIESAIEKMSQLEGEPKNLKIVLGPGICKRHFEIKDDVLNEFGKYSKYTERSGGKIFVDLKGIIKKQLDVSGVRSENVEDIRECTVENLNYFSYRRDKSKEVKAMAAVIGRKKQNIIKI